MYGFNKMLFLDYNCLLNCPHNRSQQLRNCEMWIHKAQNQAHAPLLTNCVNLGMLFYLKPWFLIYKMGVMTSTL